MTRFAERKKAKYTGRFLKKIERYWMEFRDDFMPTGLSPLLINLCKLSFFWGAMMTIFYRRDVWQIIPEGERESVLALYRRDVEFSLEALHRERRIILGRETPNDIENLP